MAKIETHRTQVPDRDPQYIEIRKERLSSVKDDIWAGSAIYLNDYNTRNVERADVRLFASEQEKARIEALIEQFGDETGKLKERRDEMDTAIANEKKFIAEMHQENEDRLRRIFGELFREMYLMEGIEADSEANRFLRGQFAEMLNDPEIISQIRSFFGDKAEKLTLTDLLISNIKRELPVDLLYKMAHRHVELTKERAREAEKLFEQYKAEFMTALREGVEAGWLPVSLERAAARLELVKCHIMDQMSHPRSGTLGNHDANGDIGLSTRDLLTPESIPRLRRTIFHELIHEIAGKLIQMKITEDDSYGRKDIYGHIVDRKTGVSIASEQTYTGRFKWLNEAITEWLALRLSGDKSDTQEFAYKGSSSYPEERKELDRLFAAGLTESVVLEAYFEDIDSEQPAEGKGRHFGALIKAVNDIEGDRAGFHRLENRFLLDEIAISLQDVRCYAAKRVANDIKLPTGTKTYEVSLSVGVRPKVNGKRPDSSVEEKFVYFLYPPDESLGLTAEDTEQAYKRFEERVKGGVYRVGKGKYRYTITER